MKQLLNTKAAAPLVGHEAGTLENWRVKGIGPRFIKGPGKKGKILYDPDDLASWRDQHKVSSTTPKATA